MVKISASLLAADLSCLREEIHALEAAGANRLHFDIMDNHYVPNLTFGAGVIKSLRPHTGLVFEAHLMVMPVDSIIPSICLAGADIVLMHPGATLHLHRTLKLIKDQGKQAGIVLNPSCLPESLIPILDLVDQVLIMTVNPGFGGQTFLECQLPKIRCVYEMLEGRPIELSIDGGINALTARKCIDAGAQILVAGSSIFMNNNYAYNIQALR